uniref:Uncharacterized protein n=1 Tax=viral metagenome TaxID=1070528 RepID=A0A6C0JAR6_9ZZZZ
MKIFDIFDKHTLICVICFISAFILLFLWTISSNFTTILRYTIITLNSIILFLFCVLLYINITIICKLFDFATENGKLKFSKNIKGIGLTGKILL